MLEKLSFKYQFIFPELIALALLSGFFIYWGLVNWLE